ncbi:hypothetical protein FQA47_022666 [Oryzias melastigma]|uniref:Uncharacterized protein n=1 Tax=Oryzias melastigma TaxID=30732 RepID=A0A834BW91_ORYME|nr:hypothetical protein FQA47_022666 [Oryzias melastigma]
MTSQLPARGAGAPGGERHFHAVAERPNHHWQLEDSASRWRQNRAFREQESDGRASTNVPENGSGEERRTPTAAREPDSWARGPRARGCDPVRHVTVVFSLAFRGLTRTLKAACVEHAAPGRQCIPVWSWKLLEYPRSCKHRMNGKLSMFVSGGSAGLQVKVPSAVSFK